MWTSLFVGLTLVMTGRFVYLYVIVFVVENSEKKSYGKKQEHSGNILFFTMICKKWTIFFRSSADLQHCFYEDRDSAMPLNSIKKAETINVTSGFYVNSNR